MNPAEAEGLQDYVRLRRAARIVAPIADHLGELFFEGGIHHILQMLAEFEIATEAERPPPKFRGQPLEERTREWFGAIVCPQIIEDDDIAVDRNREFFDWAISSLRVSRNDIIRHLAHPAWSVHPPVAHVDAAGANWSFPQALAWIATRDPIEVARMDSADHFGPPLNERGSAREMIQSDAGRRRLVGWLVLTTSIHHCHCGSRATVDREAWETCQCVGNAYDELWVLAHGSRQSIPEYRPSPMHASFTLSWSKSAHKLRFPRTQLLEQWPQRSVRNDAKPVAERRPRGRPKGSGSMSEADQPLLEKMRLLIANGRAFSANGAAILVVGQAVGGGSEASRSSRLAKRFLQSKRK